MGNLSGWPYWKVISLTGQSGAGTDYQVKFEIGDSAGGNVHLEGHCTNFPQDIRITDDDGTTLLDHFVEDLTADPIIVHVEVKDDLGSNRDIRVYYGKSGETTASDGAATFPDFFDDFNRSNSNTVGNGWTESYDDSFSIENNMLKAVWVSGHNYAECHKTAPIGTYIYQAKVKASQTNSYGYFLFHDYTNLNRLGTFMRNDGNVRAYSSQEAVLGAYSADTWYTASIKYRPGDDQFDAEYSNIGSVSNQTPHTNPADTRLRIVTGAGVGTFYFDHILVRKYNSPEPAFSSAGAEQSAAGAPTGVFYGPFVGPFGGPL